MTGTTASGLANWRPVSTTKTRNATVVPGKVHMANTYTAITKRDGEWWIGWIEEVPGVNCQERSREELIASLRLTLVETLEFNRQEAIAAAAPDYTEEPLVI